MLWQILNGVIKGHPVTNNQLPDSFLNACGECISSKEETAESFNQFFISVGEDLQQAIPTSCLDPLKYVQPQPKHGFNVMRSTNAVELKEIVRGMKNVGAGIDGINANLFKRTFPAIAYQLIHLINICLQNGVFPNALKVAIVKPVFKSGDKKTFSNYRPISILPYVSKQLEKVIQMRTMEYLQDGNILNPKQFGFQNSKE